MLKQRFLKHTAIYLIFAFLNKGLSFLLIPLFTRYLSPEDYGIYALFLTVTLILEPFLSICFNEALGNIYYAQTHYSVSAYVSTFSLVCFFLFGMQEIFICILILLPLPIHIPFFLLLAPVVALSYIMVSVLSWMWILSEKPGQYGKFHFVYMFMQFFFQVSATAYLKLGWRGVLGSQAILATFVIIIGIVILKQNKWLSLHFNKICLYDGLRFGIGMIPNILAVRLNDSVGRLFVARFFNLSDTGIYSVGQKLGAIVNVYCSALLNVYRPWLFKRLANGMFPGEQKIKLSIFLSTVSLILFASCGSILMYFLGGLVLGSQFAGSLVYIFWSVASYTLYGIYCIISLFIYQTGKSWFLSLLTVSAVILNSIFTWYFLRAFGMIGAAYAPALTWAIIMLLAIVVSFHLWKKKKT